MSLTINTNIASMMAQRALAATNGQQKYATERLSSGLRINSAADDAAGLAITDSMTSQIRGSTVALRNANDGISAMQVADGAMSNINDVLQRIRELAVQSANGIYSASDRQAMQAEVDQLISGLYSTTDQTNFNGIPLFDGNYDKALQIGPNTTADNQLNVSLPELLTKTTITTPPTSQTIYDVYTQVDTTPNSALNLGDLILNGTAVPPTVAGSGPGQSAASGWAYANAITAANIPGLLSVEMWSSGVPAGFQRVIDSSTGNYIPSFASIPAGAMVINGVPIGAISAANGMPPNTVQGLYDDAQKQIQMASTGLDSVSIDNAYLGGEGVKFNMNFTGVDCDVQETIPGTLAIFNIAPFTLHCAFSIKTINTQPPGNALVVSGNNPNKAGLTAGTYSPNMTDTTHSTIITIPGNTSTVPAEPGTDVLTQANALKMMDWVTSKLDFIDTTRAYAGAVQNRISTTVSNLQSSIETKSASRSRILDADFAKETAALARSQILKQAGTAMLAQANALPNQVLPLLNSVSKT